MRREFPGRVKRLGWDRSGGHCELCTAKLYPGKFRYDHVVADHLGGEPTLENLQVICIACDSEKTYKHDVPRIAKMRRQRSKHIGAQRPRQGFRGWKRFSGEIVWARDR